MQETASDAPLDVSLTLSTVNALKAATDLLWSPVLRKYPGLKFVMSEGGTGWVPHFLERIDRVYQRQHNWTGQDFGDKLPSEIFAEHVVLSFVKDEAGMAMRERIGVDLMCWEYDYPHSDCEWPDAPETLVAYLGGVSDSEIDKVTHLNAMRHFKFDPFAKRPKEKCTVGALRFEARDVDVSNRSSGWRSTGIQRVPSTFRAR
jgi:predicted TIM-barrel fold metal-dependent hydrolase